MSTRCYAFGKILTQASTLDILRSTATAYTTTGVLWASCCACCACETLGPAGRKLLRARMTTSRRSQSKESAGGVAPLEAGTSMTWAGKT